MVQSKPTGAEVDDTLLRENTYLLLSIADTVILLWLKCESRQPLIFHFFIKMSMNASVKHVKCWYWGIVRNRDYYKDR